MGTTTTRRERVQRLWCPACRCDVSDFVKTALKRERSLIVLRSQRRAHASGLCIRCYQRHGRLNRRTGVLTFLCAVCAARQTAQRRAAR